VLVARTQGAADFVTTVSQLLVGALVVLVPGVLPALVLIGPRAVSVFIAPIIGAVTIALGATLSVLLGVTLVWGWVAVALVVNVCCVLLGRRLDADRAALHFDPWTLLAAVTGSASAILWAGSRALSWDVHSFWYSRGRWFLLGPDYVREQLTSPFTSPYVGAAHAQYPPLPSTVPALMWELTGDDVNYYAAKVLLASVTGCALVVLALGVARLLGRPRWIGWVGALVVPPAALYFATLSSAYGHQDLPYAAAGEAALIFGLLLPRRSAELTVAIALSLMSGMVKNEGLVITVLIALLVSLRYSGRRLVRFGLLAGPWLFALGAWQLVMKSLPAGPAPPSGVTQGDRLDALRPLPSPEVTTLVHLAATHLWWLGLPLLVGLVVLVVLRLPNLRLPAPLLPTLVVHAVVVVPLVAVTGFAISQGPSLPWRGLLAHTVRYATFPRLALAVCLLALAAAALRTALGLPDDDPADPDDYDRRIIEGSSGTSSAAPVLSRTSSTVTDGASSRSTSP
jgi:hypothetical protein